MAVYDPFVSTSMVRRLLVLRLQGRLRGSADGRRHRGRRSSPRQPQDCLLAPHYRRRSLGSFNLPTRLMVFIKQPAHFLLRRRVHFRYSTSAAVLLPNGTICRWSDVAPRCPCVCVYPCSRMLDHSYQLFDMCLRLVLTILALIRDGGCEELCSLQCPRQCYVFVYYVLPVADECTQKSVSTLIVYGKIC